MHTTNKSVIEFNLEMFDLLQKLHLPPSVEGEKTADSSDGMKTGCGSSKNSSLDF